MKLFVITGVCGAVKSTLCDALSGLLDPSGFACIDTDEVGLNWWDYAGTDHESVYSDACLAEAVRRAEGKDLVFASCLNPQDYYSRHTVPEEVESTVFIVLCPEDRILEERLRNRPAERGFTSEEAIRPHLEYNRWFRKNRGKFPLMVDNTGMEAEKAAGLVADFIRRAAPGR